MTWKALALAVAGLIGVVVAIVHGIALERRLLGPLGALLREDRSLSAPMQRLVPTLLHVGTVAWLAGGLALVVAAYASSRGAVVATGLLVGVLYVHAALGNLRAIRGFHPGWMLMSVAVALIAFGMWE